MKANLELIIREIVKQLALLAEKVNKINQVALEDNNEIDLLNVMRIKSTTQCQAIMMDHTPFDFRMQIKK